MSPPLIATVGLKSKPVLLSQLLGSTVVFLSPLEAPSFTPVAWCRLISDRKDWWFYG